MSLMEKLQKALDYMGGTHTMEDIARICEEGKARAWIEDESVVIVEILDFPQQRVANFWLAAGDMETCLRIARRAEKHYRELGCTRATFTGRRGWLKSPLVTEDGWRPTLQSFDKEL